MVSREGYRVFAPNAQDFTVSKLGAPVAKKFVMPPRAQYLEIKGYTFNHNIKTL